MRDEGLRIDDFFTILNPIFFLYSQILWIWFYMLVSLLIILCEYLRNKKCWFFIFIFINMFFNQLNFKKYLKEFNKLISSKLQKN